MGILWKGVAVARGVPLQLDENQPFLYAHCASRTLACVFAPWTNCSSGTGPSTIPLFVPHTTVEHFKLVPYPAGHGGMFLWRAIVTEHLFVFNVRMPRNLPADWNSFSPCPAQYTRITLGDGMWQSETAAWLDLAEEKRRVGWVDGDRVIGVHIRQGDSCHTNIRRGKCVLITNHIAEVRMMARRYGCVLLSEVPSRNNIVGIGDRFI
jgi:hypothetical protein